MTRLVIVVEKTADWAAYYPASEVVTATDYLQQAPATEGERTQVINLCRNYRYQGLGYYVSLLADARGHRVIPSVRSINNLSRRSLYGVDVEDLSQRLAKALPADRDEFSLLVCFGQCATPALADLARQLFETFPCPILRVEFERGRIWRIAKLRAAGLHSLEDAEQDQFAAALDGFSRKIWRKPRARKVSRYDLAMLYDPDEALPPSNKKAMQHFISAGKNIGIDVDPITRTDYARLAEYDGLFIRETTTLTNHTYQFAHRAEREDMVVIDDPQSILRCTNKIYLRDLLVAKKLPIPKTEAVFRDDANALAALPDKLGFPIVLKIPDGSFSRGTSKVETPEALKQAAETLFQQSALLLAQEYIYTEFDWRIGVLNREPLYACQYFMSRGHWQIYNHAAKGGARTGGFATLPIRQAPSDVVKLATRAAGAIGDGLYGVDLKKVGDRVVVIEVNDNPSIDAGVEDEYLGEDLYRRIMDEFLRRMERRRVGVRD
ncbi:MAG: RimK family protein [Lysobacteraceae bacterium]